MSFIITRKISGPKPQLIAKTGQRRRELKEAKRLQDSITGTDWRNDLLPHCQCSTRAVASLKPAKRRVRKPTADQLERVIQSIRRFGFVGAILVRGDHVVDGHIRLEAVKRLGLAEIRCLAVDHLSDEEARILALGINRIAETGEWDLEELTLEFAELGPLGFDLTVTGFTLPELDIIMLPAVLGSPDGLDQDVPEPPAVPVSRPGDLWVAGDHRVLCGDSTKAESYATVLAGDPAHAIFTDCPWNIRIENNVSGLGKHKHKDFKMASSEMSEAEFEMFVQAFTELCKKHLVDRGVFFSCIDWRHFDVVVRAARKAGLSLINTAIWHKGSGGMGAMYRSAHEMIPVLCKGDSPRTNNVQLGRHGRDRTNVWTYPGANRPGSSASKALALHPTPKPVEMVEDALLDVTARGELVLDPFLGSGTTLIAAERVGRRARCIELDPAYVDVSVRRWEELTGKSVVHAETGLSFREMAAQRAVEEDPSKG
jgi:DNA modification methylase